MHIKTTTDNSTARRARRRFGIAIAATALTAVSLGASSGAEAARGTPAKVRNGDTINCLLGSDVTRCGGGIRFV